MAVNGNICQTAFADLGKLPKKLSITQLQVALANLNALRTATAPRRTVARAQPANLARLRHVRAPHVRVAKPKPVKAANPIGQSLVRGGNSDFSLH